MCTTIRKAEVKNITITNGSIRSRWVITRDVCSSRSMRMVSASRGMGRPVLWWSTPGTLVGQDLAVCEKGVRPRHRRARGGPGRLAGTPRPRGSRRRCARRSPPRPRRWGRRWRAARSGSCPGPSIRCPSSRILRFLLLRRSWHRRSSPFESGSNVQANRTHGRRKLP